VGNDDTQASLQLDQVNHKRLTHIQGSILSNDKKPQQE
jgi:hypothetical protein